MENYLTLIGAILGSTVLVEFVKSYFSKRQVAADSLATEAGASSVLVKTVLEWATSLKARIEILEKTLTERDATIINLTAKVNRLELRLEAYEKRTNDISTTSS
jgi:phage shock protein A